MPASLTQIFKSETRLQVSAILLAQSDNSKSTKVVLLFRIWVIHSVLFSAASNSVYSKNFFTISCILRPELRIRLPISVTSLDSIA